MNKRNILFALFAQAAVGTTWAQPSLAVATYDIDGFFAFATTTTVSDEQLATGIEFFDPVIELQGNGTGSASLNLGENDVFVEVAASGSAGPAPLPTFSASAVAGEFVVDAETLLEDFGLLALNFGFGLDLAINATDPDTSAASAGYEVEVFADDLLVSSVSGLIDEFDLLDGSASLRVNEDLGRLALNDGTELFIVQYTLFGDAVSVAVPEPGVAWLAAVGLLILGAGKRLRR